MNQLINAKQISKAYGARQLFEKIDFSLVSGEKIGIVGPNGVGKSTFLKILAGLEEADSGEISYQKNIHLGYMAQHADFPSGRSILETTLAILGETSTQDISEQIDAETKARITLDKMGFDDVDKDISTLSGGWQKRVLLAQQIMRGVDVLLLDEPTNHLDLDGIEWLESYLKTAPFTFMTISHDRRFLEKCCTRIIEINTIFPEVIFSYNSGYETFVEKRDQFLETQARQAKNTANKARIELEWLKRGARARSTKQKARIQGAYTLFEKCAGLKERTKEDKKIKLEFDATERKTKRLLTLNNASKSYGNTTLFKEIDITLIPGMRIGLLGANGCGKSTFMNLIAGTLEGDTGKRTTAHGVQVVKFDQSRELLDQSLTVREAVSPSGANEIEYRGKQIHVSSWIRKLRFRSDQLESPVKLLSGGEQARVLMGQLMLQPADVLLLDEPTNDLDIPSLEILEEALTSFPGALVLVTHDREMLDRVCHVLLAFEGEGVVKAYADYEQYLKAQEKKGQIEEKPKDIKAEEGKNEKPKTISKRKFTYKEQQDWETLETRILEAEEKVETLSKQDVSALDSAELAVYYQTLSEATANVEALYERWTELEGILNTI